MDIDTLIFILVVLAIIFSNLFKMIRNAAKTGTGKKTRATSGWRKALSGMMEQIREEMRKASEREAGEKPAGRGSGWEQVMTPAPRPEERGVKDAPELREAFEEAIRKPYPTEPVPEISRPDRASYEVGAIGAMYQQDRKKGPSVVISRRNLRQAVIWSEILAKPVGLRDLDN